jgi:hypothetical protein
VVPSSRLVSVSLTLPWLEILETDLVGHPFGGRRHQLHQAGSTHRRLCAGDEAAFLAHQTIHPGVIKRLILSGRSNLFAIRRQVAQRIVVFGTRAVGGRNRTVVIARAAGQSRMPPGGPCRSSRVKPSSIPCTPSVRRLRRKKA